MIKHTVGEAPIITSTDGSVWEPHYVVYLEGGHALYFDEGYILVKEMIDSAMKEMDNENITFRYCDVVYNIPSKKIIYTEAVADEEIT